MTTEQKAKAYDEALERARKIHSEIVNNELLGFPGQIEDIFPQLRESESERIRKGLINFLQSPFIKENLTDEKVAPWLAYLEKQKEPDNVSASTMIPSFHEELTEFELVLFNAVLDNNFVGAKGSENALAMTKKVTPALLAIAKKEQDWNKKPCLTCQEYEKGFKQGHLEGCTAGYNKAMKEMEQNEPHYTKRNALFDKCVENCDPKIMKEVSDKVDEILQKEQKPMEYLDKDKIYAIMRKLHDLSFSEDILIDSKEYKKIDEITHDVSSLLDYPIEQKPAEWSEEDKKLIDDVMNSLCCYQNTLPHYQKEIVGEEIRKLKSLIPKPKQEWSEKDEKMRDRLIDRLQFITLNTRTDTTSPNITFFDEIDWLKSIRPSWKPSEEHLSALLAIFNDPNNIGSQTCQLALTDLYEQLKML